MPRYRFKPYHSSAGPSFWLEIEPTDKVDDRGQTFWHYRFGETGNREPIFEGRDLSPSPLCRETWEIARACMGFLTLKPGDTDAEYFAGYTDRQRAFAEEHADHLSWEVTSRWGEA